MFREFHYQVRGRGHARDGTRGQDRTAFLSRGGVQVLCLSDGAGSATHSEFGAQALVDAGCKLMIERFFEFETSGDGVQLKLGIVRHLLGRLDEVATRLAVGVGDLAATFLAVAVSGNRFLVVHVGDGVVGYVKSGHLRVASGPDNSEFVNQTTFLTSERAVVGVRILRGSLDDVSGFVLMSDGTAASLYNARSNELAPACAKLVEWLGFAPSHKVRYPSHVKQLRRFVDTRIRPATKDDCSIGILARPLRAADHRA